MPTCKQKSGLTTGYLTTEQVIPNWNLCHLNRVCITNEPPHDITNKMACATSKVSDQPGHPPSLFACSDQTGQMPRLIWVFAGSTVILLVLSWGSSNTCSPLCSNVEKGMANSVVPDQTAPSLFVQTYLSRLTFNSNCFCKEHFGTVGTSPHTN